MSGGPQKIPLTAEEARRLVKESLNNGLVQEYIKTIDQKIRQACANSKTCLHEPFSGINRDELNYSQKIKIRQYYESQGFKWEEHSSGRNEDYEKICWGT